MGPWVGLLGTWYNIAELWEINIIVARAAQLSECKKLRLWKEALIRAASVVEFYQDEIRAIADVLEKRNRITRFQRGVKSVLGRVATRSFRQGVLSARGQALIDEINNVMREF